MKKTGFAVEGGKETEKRMEQLSDEKVILRDFIESDIQTRIRWETEETEWQAWDAPWEFAALSGKEREGALAEYIEKMRGWAENFSKMPKEEKRTGFQIVEKSSGEYIGWCNSYRIDEDCNISEEGGKCAVGIDLPSMRARGKGYAFSALCLFIRYLLGCGETEIYTQTWSGNVRMIALAEKIGFEEYRRKKDYRTVSGKKYDGLTFRLNLEKFRFLG